MSAIVFPLAWTSKLLSIAPERLSWWTNNMLGSKVCLYASLHLMRIFKISSALLLIARLVFSLTSSNSFTHGSMVHYCAFDSKLYLQKMFLWEVNPWHMCSWCPCIVHVQHVSTVGTYLRPPAAVILFEWHEDQTCMHTRCWALEGFVLSLWRLGVEPLKAKVLSLWRLGVEPLKAKVLSLWRLRCWAFEG